jgi:acyl-CoA synthetase (AMP-forming)/AMP-acid ligase II/thioesterase domain-containing protein/acyl carrier protein
MMQKSEPDTILDLVFNRDQNPDHPAIESPGSRPLTYRELKIQVIHVIKTLKALGFGRNDRIAAVMPAGPETAVLGIAIMAGFTHTPLNPQFREPEFQVIFSRLNVKAVIVQKNSATAARAVAVSQNIPVIEITPSPDQAGSFFMNGSIPEGGEDIGCPSPEDTAIVMQTSGTTALPKTVPLTQRQVCTSARVLCSEQSLTAQDKSLHIVPHFHLLGVIGTVLVPLAAGGSVICTRDFIPPDFPGLLKTCRPTFYVAGPAHHQAILQELKKVPPGGLKDHSLRFIRSVSAPMPAPVRQELGTLLGVPVYESYAMTESPNITINMAGKAGSVGIPLIESLVILDEDGNQLGRYSTGEVSIRGGVVFSGYEDAPQENASAFTNGWFRTGDMGYLDDEGYLYLTGRKKELINKGGEKISPAEVDQVLMTHPAVRQAMAFRVTDPVLGEDIAAMAVLEDVTTREEDLRRFLLDRLVPFKVPRRIYRVDEIPRGPTGKLLRYVGTQRYSGSGQDKSQRTGHTGDPVSPAVSVFQEKLLQIWKDLLNVPSVSLDDDFFRSGGNSLAAIELLIKIQRVFSLSVPADMVYQCPTIRQQALMIAQKSGTGRQYHPLIVPLREGGTLPPLFCMHPLGGWIREYQYISRFLDQDRPVYGIRARGLETEEKPALTIEEAVAEYSEAVRTVRQRGPYHLLGFSGGGIYALELACRLQEQGESVPYLGIIDVSLPAAQNRLFNQIRFKKPNLFIAAGLSLYSLLNTRLKTKPGSILYSLFVRGAGAISRILIVLQGSPSLPSEAGFTREINHEWFSVLPERQQELVKKQIGALSIYHPRTFSGNITLFSTGPDSEFYPNDPARGWNSCITGKTIIIDVPGDHISLHEDPLGQVTAQKIEESLKLADRP